ncbi:MAG: DUF1732 domain-containing protein [Chitinophagales bacterium]|nr:DUF1732 domain-containing protein [Chitinophagales bacterium]
MILSMTGYGRTTFYFREKQFLVEMKTLNSKGFELLLKIPAFLKPKEMEIRQLIANHLERGKLEFQILEEQITDSSGEFQVRLQQKLDDLKRFALKNNLSIDSVLPALILSQQQQPEEATEPLEETSWEEILKTITETIVKLNEFRKKEGAFLGLYLRERLAQLELHAISVKDMEGNRFERQRERLKQITQTLQEESINHDRFEQELLYYMEKWDISEELSRLQAHLSYFMEVLDNSEMVKGKKLGFIAQEIGREINTLGAKASDAPIQKVVVQMKDELERIKEQVSNVL